MKIQICRGRLPTARYGILLALTASVAGISAPFQSDAADHLPLIQGVVTNELTGEPLRKAFLRLRPVSGSGIVRPAVTDIQGRFVIEHIDPGKYRLETERQGFIDSQNGSTTGGSLELSISAGHSVTGLKVKLTPQAVISGRIVDEDGDAWTHAQAGILRSSWREGKRHLEGYGGGPVDDQGRFRIGQLPPGKYYIAAEPYSDWERQNRSVLDRSTRQLQPTWYPHSHEVEGSAAIILSPGQELSGLEIRLIKGEVHSIRGSVAGLNMKPSASNQSGYIRPGLSASLLSKAAANIYPGTLRPDGSFEIGGIPPGDYQLKVAHGIWPLQGLGHTTVHVSDQNVENVSIVVQPSHPLKGIVRIEGDEALHPFGLAISLELLDDTMDPKPAITLSDGSFEFEQIFPERYRVRVFGGTIGDYYIRSIRYGDTESLNGIIPLTDPQKILELVLSTRGARLTGKVERGADGADSRTTQSPSTPQVVLIPETADTEQRDYQTQLGLTDQNGVFAISHIAPGKYTLYAFESVPEGSWTDPEFLKEISKKGVEIQFGEGDTKALQVPIILKSDIADLLIRLGIN